MNRVLAAVAACAFVSSLAGAAGAADYEPPIFIDEVQEVVPVEIGSGWYLRGDVGYTFSSRFKDYVEDSTVVPGLRYGEDNTALFGGVGVGYHFTDYLRADLTVAFLRNEDAFASYTDPAVPGVTGRADIETAMGYGMFTGYVDLGTYMGLTPYVGAGAGMIYSRPKGSGSITLPDGSRIGASYRKDDFSFAYTLNAGLAYALTQNLSLDVGYQYLNAPNAEYFSVEKAGFYDKGFDLHQIKLGLRYDLW